jgi:hypothetical protein
VQCLDTATVGCLNTVMEIGEVWAFRDQPKAWGDPVHRVEVVRLTGPRRQGDAHIRFLDSDEAGLQEWVSLRQLIVPWAQVESLRDDEQRWIAVVEQSRQVRGSIEFDAARLVFDFVRPKNLIRLRHVKADAGVVEVTDLDTVASLVGISTDELCAEPSAFQDRAGTYVAPWPTTLRLARGAAQALGAQILDTLLQRERQLRHRYEQALSWRRDDTELERFESVALQVREWCTGQAVERFDEIRALRAEVERLGELVTRAVDELRRRKCHAIAATIEHDLGVPISRGPGSR